MRVHGRSMLLGAAAAVVALVAGIALLMHAGGPVSLEQHHRSLKLAAGGTLEVTALYLAFGDEHSGRGAIDDGEGVHQ